MIYAEPRWNSDVGRKMHLIATAMPIRHTKLATSGNTSTAVIGNARPRGRRAAQTTDGPRRI